MVAFIIALAKAVPAIAAILEQAADGYRAWRVQENSNEQASKDRRNDAAVDAAGGVSKP